MGDARWLALGGLGLAAAVGMWVARKSRRTGYDDLDNVVSFTSRIVAAFRALESQEEEPLFTDPLAHVLAGERGIATTRHSLKEYNQDVPVDQRQERSGRKYQVSRVALRTLFIDARLLAATREGARQVVLLGAGMDARAWRLDLPEGVSWFEVDMTDVLAAKHRVLTGAGASFSTGSSEVGVKFPLKASRYTSCSLNLEDPAWPQDLLAAGFDPSARTVWIAEGLVTYLSENAVVNLLKKTSELSARGSHLLVMAVADCTSAELQQWFRERSTSLPAHLLKEWMESFKSIFPKDTDSYMAEKGWMSRETLRYHDLAERYAKGLQWSDRLSGSKAVSADEKTLYIDATAAK